MPSQKFWAKERCRGCQGRDAKDTDDAKDANDADDAEAKNANLECRANERGRAKWVRVKWEWVQVKREQVPGEIWAKVQSKCRDKRAKQKRDIDEPKSQESKSRAKELSECEYYESHKKTNCDWE